MDLIPLNVSHDGRAFLDKGNVNGVGDCPDMTSLLACKDIFQLDPGLSGTVLSWLGFAHSQYFVGVLLESDVPSNLQCPNLNPRSSRHAIIDP